MRKLYLCAKFLSKTKLIDPYDIREKQIPCVQIATYYIILNYITQ